MTAKNIIFKVIALFLSAMTVSPALEYRETGNLNVAVTIILFTMFGLAAFLVSEMETTIQRMYSLQIDEVHYICDGECLFIRKVTPTTLPIIAGQDTIEGPDNKWYLKADFYVNKTGKLCIQIVELERQPKINNFFTKSAPAEA